MYYSVSNMDNTVITIEKEETENAPEREESKTLINKPGIFDDTNVEIVYNSAGKGTISKYKIWNYDFQKLYIVLGLSLLTGMLVGIGELIKYKHPNYQFEDIEVWKWIRILSLVPGIYISGATIDLVIYFIIDLFGYFQGYFTTILYYASSFKNLLGHIIVTILFKEYYEVIVGLEMNDIIHKGIILVLITYALLAVRNFIVNLVMRKRLIMIFKNNIRKVLLYKDIIYNLSYNMSGSDRIETGKAKKIDLSKNYNENISWKFVKLKSSGFEVWYRGTKTQIFKKDKIILLADDLWSRLIMSYKCTQEFENSRQTINSINQKYKLNRISSKFIVSQMELSEENILYEDVRKLFDPQNNSYISENDFREGIIKIFNIWKDSDSFMVGYNNLSTILKHLMSAITYVLICIIGLNIFDIPLQTVFVPLATVIVTISFAISRVLGDMTASILFVVFMNPYQVGERVSINDIEGGSTMVVTKINILTTEFMIRKSARLIQIPNHKLYSANICNHHHTKMAVFNLKYTIPSDTPKNKIDLLLDNINEHLKTLPNDWKPEVEIYIDDIRRERNYMSISLWVQHYIHWGNSKIYDSKTELELKINSLMEDMHFDYKQPDLPILMEKEKVD